MAEVKWIKLCTDIFDDEKVLLIESLPEGDSILVIWFKLLCLAGKQNNNGVFMLTDRIAYTDEMLATIFRRPITTVRMAINTFASFGMIEIVQNTITIPNWEKHQNIDKLADLREYNRLAKQKSREKKKQLENVNDNVNDKSMTSQRCQGLDKEEDIDIKKNISQREIQKESVTCNVTSNEFEPFMSSKPTLEQVLKVCKELGFEEEMGKQFFYHYDAIGWIKSGVPMDNWVSALNLWASRQHEFEKPKATKETKGAKYKERDIKDSEFEALFTDLKEIEL